MFVMFILHNSINFDIRRIARQKYVVVVKNLNSMNRDFFKNIDHFDDTLKFVNIEFDNIVKNND